MKYLIIPLLVGLLSGCNAVLSDKPIGELAFETPEETWNGVWMHSEGVVTIEVTNEKAGELTIAWVERQKLESYSVHMRRINSTIVGNIKGPEGHYIWARMKIDDRQIIAWLPNIDQFRQLVSDKKLPGIAPKKGDVILKDLNRDHNKLLVETNSPLFNWSEPLILTRILDSSH